MNTMQVLNLSPKKNANMDTIAFLKQVRTCNKCLFINLKVRYIESKR